MSHDVETSFLDRWTALGADLLGGDDEPWSSLGQSLLNRHTEPLRRYHGARHVIAVLDTTEALNPARSHRPALRLAAYFHDAIYDPTASDNEERSAVLAETELARFGISEATIEETARFIRATDGHESDGSDDVALFLDADLAILGTPADVYDRYAAAIRHEYNHLADDVFFPGRAAVLQMFLDRPRLFFTDAGRNRFEAQARVNLAREIGLLTTQQ